jgi:hypothetical protein
MAEKKLVEKKPAELSAVSLEVLEFLKTNESATLAEIKAAIPAVNPSNLTALRNRELVNAVEIEIPVQVTVKRKVLSYSVKSE